MNNKIRPAPPTSDNKTGEEDIHHHHHPPHRIIITHNNNNSNQEDGKKRGRRGIDIGVNFAGKKYKNKERLKQLLLDSYHSGVMAVISISNSLPEVDINLQNIQLFSSLLPPPPSLLLSSSPHINIGESDEYRNHPHYYYYNATIGVHPHHADDVFNEFQLPPRQYNNGGDGGGDDNEEKMLKERVMYVHEQLIRRLGRYFESSSDFIDKSIVAIGECGLDYNRMFSTKSNQLAVFISQITLAKHLKKPLYIHCRDAFEDVVNCLKQVDYFYGVIHCFTGNAEQAIMFISLGLYIGITGWIMDNRRNQDLVEALKFIPIDKIVVETDAPWVSVDRKRNSVPSDIFIITQRIAEIKGIESETAILQFYENTKILFPSLATD